MNCALRGVIQLFVIAISKRLYIDSREKSPPEVAHNL